MPTTHWVHDLSPFLIRFSDNFGIRYYGLTYLLGFVAAVGLLHLYHRKGRSPVGGEQIGDLITYLFFGVMLGGRLGYFLLYQLDTVTRDPLAIFRVWEGGMASHGGFVGVVVALLLFARRRGLSFFVLADLIVSAAPPGLCFVRIANFINGELWGRTTNVAWAVIFPHSAEPGTKLYLIPARHPSQLYEAFLEGVVLFALMQWRFWRSDITRTSPGRLGGEFLVAYALLRMVGELFREPDASLILGISRGSFYSIFMIAAGLALILRRPPPATPANPA